MVRHMGILNGEAPGTSGREQLFHGPGGWRMSSKSYTDPTVNIIQGR